MTAKGAYISIRYNQYDNLKKKLKNNFLNPSFSNSFEQQQREQRILFLDNRVLKINIYIYRSKFKFMRLHENRLLGWIIRKKKKPLEP